MVDPTEPQQNPFCEDLEKNSLEDHPAFSVLPAYFLTDKETEHKEGESPKSTHTDRGATRL